MLNLTRYFLIDIKRVLISLGGMQMMSLSLKNVFVLPRSLLAKEEILELEKKQILDQMKTKLSNYFLSTVVF